VTQHQRSHIRGPYRQKSPYTTMDKILMMAVLLFILFVTERFKKLPDAERFAAGRQCWSAPAKPELVTLPKRIASRYAIR
jgi:hypothetical protein